MFDNYKLEKSMQLLKKGDSRAFDTIYNETHRMVYYIIYPIIKDHGRAEDVMQNVFVNIYEKISQYNENTSAKAWIATIARNLAINEYNKYKKEIIVDVDQAINITSKDTYEETPLIDIAVEHLDKEDFMIVMLCICEGYKRREVAELLNLSTSGVTWKLDHALKKLKTIMEGGHH